MRERPWVDTHSIRIGYCYRRLSQLARRMARAQGRGERPDPADVAEATQLREVIAALKGGADTAAGGGW